MSKKRREGVVDRFGRARKEDEVGIRNFPKAVIEKDNGSNNPFGFAFANDRASSRVWF